MSTEAMQRLVARIEELCGLDLGLRTAELDQWLRAREPTLTTIDDPTIDRFTKKLMLTDSKELTALLGRFTVSYTRFFRDAEQLAVVAATLARLNRRMARLWIAGCSTGEEAYTMALLCRAHGCEVEIVASDVNRQSLAQGRSGCYDREALKVVPPKYYEDFIASGAQVEISARIRRRVTFVEHSLMQVPLRPSDGMGWDLILCRNVLIYFRAGLSEKTLDQLASVVTPGGYIVLGTSEFHLRTSELFPARIAERIFLQRPIGPPPEGSSERSAAKPLERLPAASIEMKSARALALEAQDAVPAAGPAPRRVTPVATLTVLLFSGNHDAVLKEALPVLMRDAEQQPMLILSGIAYHMKGRHYEAVAMLEKTLSQHPSCWPAAYFLAASLESLMRLEEALAAYRTIEGAVTPTSAAQALIDLLDLQPWKSEVMALARRRLKGSSDQTSPLESRHDVMTEPEKGSPHDSHSS